MLKIWPAGNNCQYRNRHLFRIECYVKVEVMGKFERQNLWIIEEEIAYLKCSLCSEILASVWRDSIFILTFTGHSSLELSFLCPDPSCINVKVTDVLRNKVPILETECSRDFSCPVSEA